MNITLNFQDNYIPFYEWLDTDEIKKYTAPVYLVSTKIINDLMIYKTIIDDDSLMILTDEYSFIAINKNKKSSLLLEDEEKIINSIKKINKKEIKYQKISKVENNKNLRHMEYIKEYLLNAINHLKDEKTLEKIEYIYFEWFKKTSTSKNKMINDMILKINNNFNEDDIKIYNLLKDVIKVV